MIPDPPLSGLGRAQCQELSQSLQANLPKDLESRIGLIVTSAMRRTCETTMLSLGWLLEKESIPVLAHAGWQENSAKPCDTGSPIPVVAAEFPRISFGTVDPVYPDKMSPAGDLYHYRKDKLLARAQAVLGELYARPEDAVVVVSHSGFMRQAVTGDHYFNADYRIYDFEERSAGDEGAPFKLRQWDLTKGTGGMGRSYDQIVELGVGLPDEDLPPNEDVALPAGVIPN